MSATPASGRGAAGVGERRRGRAPVRAGDQREGERRQDGGAHQAASKSAAAPMPPPMHIVTTPYRPPRRFSSRSSVAVMPRAGDAQRMAERDGAAVRVHLRPVEAQLADAVQRLRGEGLVQLEDVDVLHLELVLRQQLAHRRDRADAHDLRRHAGHLRSRRSSPAASRPSAFAFASVITTAAPAPSVSGEALPAVTVPLGLKAGFSLASPSSVVSGAEDGVLGDGDLDAPLPASSKTSVVTGTISSLKHALLPGLGRAALALVGERVLVGAGDLEPRATFSAVAPIEV